MTRLRRSLRPDDVVDVRTDSVVEIPLFVDDEDRERFCRLLELVAKRYDWIVHSHSLMPSHYRLVVEAPGGTLSAGMQMLNGGYARGYNKRYGRVGHALMGVFRATRIESETQLAEVCRHVVLSPPRAGICGHPRDWRWSSYGPAVAAVKPPPFLRLDRLLAFFGSDRETATRRFAEFVDDALTLPSPAPS